MNKLGGDSNEISIEIFFLYTLGMRHDFKIHFLQVPIDLVIDHFVQFDVARWQNVVRANMELEFQRNKEIFGFLK